jgi:hypothetical protein
MFSNIVINAYNLIYQIHLYLEVRELEVLGLTPDEICGDLDVMLDNIQILPKLHERMSFNQDRN